MENLALSSEIALRQNYSKALSQLRRFELTGSGMKPMSGAMSKWMLKRPKASVVVKRWDDLFISNIESSYSAYYLQEINDTSVITTSLDWYIFLQSNHTKELSIDEMSPIIKGIHNLIKNEKWSYLNDILFSSLNSSSSPESIVCVLRASFSVKEKLKNWKDLINNSKAWLSKQGRDIEEDLIGLF